MDPFLKPDDQIIIVDDFLTAAMAQSMRDGIERHFGHPQSHRSGHQIWNYWHVPGFYTYLRTNADRVIERHLIGELVLQIKGVVDRRIGRNVTVSWPYLSVYTAGMGQCWHNDVGNGLMGWVYSLTEHPLDGGSTLIWRDKIRCDTPVAGSALHHIIEPRFNRLILFDDQLPHAVSTVQGTMDPLRGRVVLHGHINLS